MIVKSTVLIRLNYNHREKHEITLLILLKISHLDPTNREKQMINSVVRMLYQTQTKGSQKLLMNCNNNTAKFQFDLMKKSEYHTHKCKMSKNYLQYSRNF